MSGASARGRLVVLLGPSAVGKSTVVKRLREELPDLYFSVSMTTRGPRPGEQDGRDYFFVTAEYFQECIDKGEMLEWADIHGGLQRSGTPAQPVKNALAAGRPVLIEVDLVGARNVVAMMPEAESVFLAPPSWDTLVERLTSRGTEDEAAVNRRLETARVEMEAQHEFRHIVVNDDLEEAVTRLVRIFQS
ncbi:guanylate kinase [Corynebacterium sp. ES2715-CONJ3]|uniref:guanylate kinase n=1 Tax=Corynebacterium sp. ES2715-CONJ3 TaxID=2974028 RepID=UPI00216755F7|nr:guanylate kinase [Corynebacterium sp. ES2715-CONJ3]MCS4491083.1 guanylate kinase [Corynebacterium sp. ES2715-CONJ3]